MSEPPTDPSVPRPLLLGMGALLALLIAAAGLARWTGVGTTSSPEGTPVERVVLRFDDRPDGAVVVRAGPADGSPVDVLEPGHHGFVRSVLRGLVRARRARGIDDGPPFQLTRWADGRLSLDDPATGRTIELGAFGPANAQAFAALWTAGVDRR